MNITPLYFINIKARHQPSMDISQTTISRLTNYILTIMRSDLNHKKTYPQIRLLRTSYYTPIPSIININQDVNYGKCQLWKSN